MPIELLNPVQEPVAEVHPIAPRLSTLNGKVLGLWTNNKLNSVRLMEMIAADLARDYDFTVRTGYYYASELMPPEKWGDVDQCDAVILANGDCGACSSSGIANAIELEKRGIPSFLICTPPFVDAVTSMAKLGGMSDVKWAVVEHPIGSVMEAELASRALDAARQFRECLLAAAADAPRELALAGGK
ncbi:MAG: hypothetical protein ABW184_11735 [Sphingobium sp.]